jgi:sugar O-acyltransferase (sialic acid O-acetyltransferase NeuD family)
MRTQLLVFGGSGHAKDVIAAARASGYQTFQIVTTDGSSAIPGHPALREADFRPDDFADWDCIVAIGNNAHRRRFQTRYRDLNFTCIIGPGAVVCEGAAIGPGSFVGALAYLGPDCSLGEGSIVNTRCVVGHDARIGDFSQVGPGACLCGHVELGEEVFVGVGALFNNGSPAQPLRVADRVMIGMGCHITHSIPEPGIRILPKPNHTKLRGD